MDIEDRNNLVKQYFNRGYSYEEILFTLRELHNYTLSIRQLHRILRDFSLYRKKARLTELRDVISFIRRQLQGSGSLLGYRLMHQRCIQNGLNVTRRNVAIILKELDPEGVERRSRNVLKRRQYWSKGPNYVWHLDGYDKLKPFGFSIHGAIDGFSRRILWLKVAASNKDPAVVSNFYLETVRTLSGVPRKVVGDRGTENVFIAASQRFLRRADNDQSAGERSFKYGRSVTNQRIEAWWSMLRRTCTNWWINFFRSLIDDDIFDTSNIIHCECIKFCFYQMLKRDLDNTMLSWNNHRIRRAMNSDRKVRPAGRPNVLYFTPQLSDASIRDYKFPLDLFDFNVVKDLCCKTIVTDYICSSEFFELAHIIIQEYSLNIPNTAGEGIDLFKTLIDKIGRI
ncbi:uncharacterized protein [Clytia hemisphaerica]|uniref:Integrase catalytic domain-containing protein n=1 Tax=Clytia hemisphaerica TaxID=252671 RepID=A0A7M5UDC9_9CNID